MNKAGTHRPNRRQFIKTGITAAAIAPFAHINPARAVQAANGKLNIGIIGAGGRGAANTGGVAHENIYALCDINQNALNGAAKKFPDAKTFHDWRKLIEDDKIDAVVISTADHHHAPAAIAAMKAGKHVYCEKPLGHTVLEARRMQEVYGRNKGNLATQMGTQIHAEGTYRRVVELVQHGAIGKVSEAHVWCGRSINPVENEPLAEQPVPDWFHWDQWLGPAADRPYNQGYWNGGNLNWNRRWDFGNGVLGDMGSHLIDLPYWALDLTYPTSVQSEGPAPDPIACPPWQIITWEHPKREGNELTSGALKVFWYHGPQGMQRKTQLLQPLVGDDTNLNQWHIGVCFVGEEGVLTADYGKHVLSPSAKFADYKRPAETIPPSKGHHKEWTHACHTGEPTLCNFEYSGRLIEHNLLGIAAHRAEQKLDWDHKSFKITNAPDAAKYLTKTYRKGWTLDGDAV